MDIEVQGFKVFSKPRTYDHTSLIVSVTHNGVKPVLRETPHLNTTHFRR